MSVITYDRGFASTIRSATICALVEFTLASVSLISVAARSSNPARVLPFAMLVLIALGMASRIRTHIIREEHGRTDADDTMRLLFDLFLMLPVLGLMAATAVLSVAQLGQ
jgi:hypothetical protein